MINQGGIGSQLGVGRGTMPASCRSREVVEQPPVSNRGAKRIKLEEAPELVTGWVHNRSVLASPRACLATSKGMEIVATDVVSKKFWLDMCPQIDVHCEDSDSWNSRATPLSPTRCRELSQQKAQLQEEGYARLSEAMPTHEAQVLARAVASLVQHGWHPLWCLVFDEAWLWLSRIAPVLRAMVNESASPNCDFMSWYIDPTKCDKGWVPHRDRRAMGFDGCKPQYATIWLALTEATPLNGCMHILPANFDPVYKANEFATQTHDDELAKDWLQDIRALPCEPGEALIWTGRALHFGGRACPRAKAPRISLACAVSASSFEDPNQRCGELWQCNGTDSSSCMRMPSLNERLKVIAIQLYNYDGPLESSVNICDKQRRLLRDLDTVLAQRE